MLSKTALGCPLPKAGNLITDVKNRQNISFNNSMNYLFIFKESSFLTKYKYLSL